MKESKEEKIKELLTRGVGEIIKKESLNTKLRSNKKLRVKLGIDPTAPDIHLGHAVPLKKLREFQELGHAAVLIIGDYTARVGDPSGKDETRPHLTSKEVKANAKTYLDQAYKILDKNKTEAHFQTEWFSRFRLEDIVDLASKVTMAKLMTHETFRKRLKKDLPFALHEALYPLLQGYDSVMIKADVEIGAMEQKFNLLIGREIQKKYNQPEQEVIMTKYLLGLDGKEKMGKSLGNYIAIFDSSQDMYGKIMSIPDGLLVNYYELLTEIPPKEIIEELKKGTNPRDLKAQLAKNIIAQFHTKSKAVKAEQEFNKVFRRKEKPSKIPQVSLKARNYNIVDLISKLKLVSSKGEARRLVEQGGVKIDDRVVKDWKLVIRVRKGTLVQVGKRRFVKVK